MALPSFSPIPEIHLLLISQTAVTAFANARQQYLDPLNVVKGTLQFHIHESSLSQLEDTVKFDLIVSPANSSGILDGGFDDAISRAFAPRNDYHALTRYVQEQLHEEWKGFAPPGTCTLIPLPDDWTSAARDPPARSKNVWGARWLALLPTMRVPSAVSWDREVVYGCMWSFLNAVYRHNVAAEASGGQEIRSVCMSPLATGAGYVSEERWAQQMCLAIKHFVEAEAKPSRGAGKQRTTWPEAHRAAREVEETWRAETKGARNVMSGV